ncbi:hypothetical protein WJX84_002461 [Apatococcus fuscideae]|uniref:Exonuclease domain-containing protein n=1 Tax=Apatococcus fuscideae TaxID=2026836 RepID=A0AAW1TDR4_9CHLO
MESGHSCKSKATCGHACCDRHLNLQTEIAPFAPHQRSEASEALACAQLQQLCRAQLPSASPSQLQRPLRSVGTSAHPRPSAAMNAASATFLLRSRQPGGCPGQPTLSKRSCLVSRTAYHTDRCRDKASCLHTCCKRHLAAAASTGPTPPANAATIPPTRPAGVDAAFMKSIEQLAAAMKTNPGRPVSQSVPARSGARHDQNKAGPSQPQSQPEDSLELVSSDHKAQADTAPLHPATDRTAAGVDAPESSGLKPVAEANGRHSTGASYQDLQYEFFAFDLETTGLSPDNDRIMEIAVKHVPDRPVSESALSPAYVTLVNSGQRPNMGAYRVHKISHREATENGKPFRQVWAEMLTYVGEHCQPGTTPVLVAHNGFRFDNKILQAECARINQPLPGHWMCLDTLPLARQMLPDLASHSQAALQRAFDIPEATLQHRAKEDVEMLEQVLWKLGGSLAALMQPAAPHCGSLVTGKEPSKGASQGLQGRSEKRSSS